MQALISSTIGVVVVETDEPNHDVPPCPAFPDVPAAGCFGTSGSIFEGPDLRHWETVHLVDSQRSGMGHFFVVWILPAADKDLQQVFTRSDFLCVHLVAVFRVSESEVNKDSGVAYRLQVFQLGSVDAQCSQWNRLALLCVSLSWLLEFMLSAH